MKKPLGIRITVWGKDRNGYDEPVGFYLDSIGKRSIRIVAFREVLTLDREVDKGETIYISKDGEFWVSWHDVQKALLLASQASNTLLHA